MDVSIKILVEASGDVGVNRNGSILVKGIQFPFKYIDAPKEVTAESCFLSTRSFWNELANQVDGRIESQWVLSQAKIRAAVQRDSKADLVVELERLQERVAPAEDGFVSVGSLGIRFAKEIVFGLIAILIEELNATNSEIENTFASRVA